MSSFKPFRNLCLQAAAALCVLLSSWPAVAQQQNQDDEVQMGQEVFNELKAKGEIIESSPLYDELKPIADAITQAHWSGNWRRPSFRRRSLDGIRWCDSQLAGNTHQSSLTIASEKANGIAMSRGKQHVLN